MYVTCHCTKQQQPIQGGSNDEQESNHPRKPNIYQIVTDRIIASLRAGIIPWEKPWQSLHFTGGPFPRNFLTGKPYRGINVMLLWSSPYSYPFWLTFKQAKELKVP